LISLLISSITHWPFRSNFHDLYVFHSSSCWFAVSFCLCLRKYIIKFYCFKLYWDIICIVGWYILEYVLCIDEKECILLMLLGTEVVMSICLHLSMVN
jgi:hypothetical protein